MNVVMRLDLQPVSTTCYKNWSLHFSVAHRAESELSVKRRRSEQKSTMYTENTLKKRNMRAFPLETGADVGLQEMKEKDILDGSELAASSTLREEGRLVITKFIKAMALLYSIFNADFRNLVEEHELMVGEDLTVEVDFVLVDPPYNIQMDQKRCVSGV